MSLKTISKGSSIQKRLSFSFVLIGTLPLLIATYALLNLFTKHLKEQEFQQLAQIRDIKKSHIESYVEGVKQQTKFFRGSGDPETMRSQSTTLSRVIDDFSVAIEALGKTQEERARNAQLLYKDTPPNTTVFNKEFYEYAHIKHHDRFHAFASQFRFKNIYLVNILGTVVYSVHKDKYLGSNLHSNITQNSELKTIFKKLEKTAGKNSKKKDRFIFSGFSNKQDGSRTALLAGALHEFGMMVASIIYEVDLKNIEEILLNSSDSNGVHSLILNPEGIIQIASYNEKLNIGKSLDGHNQTHSTSSGVEIATTLQGDEALRAYSTLDIFGEKWHLLTEKTTEDAFATVNKWTTLIFIFSLSIIIFLIFAGYFLAKSISKPILSLTQVAKRIAGGKYSTKLNLKRSDEIGSLAESFGKMQNAISEKVSEIEQQNKDLKKHDELKNDLLANTTHELKTPLNGIIGLAESLTKVVPKNYSNTLSHIIQSGQRLSLLVNDILDASQLKHNEINLNKKSINLRQAVDINFSVSSALIGNKNVSLINDIPSDINVSADFNRLQQILQNLVGNAIKFTDFGVISAKCHKENQNISITIEDTGIGIPKEDHEIIFETFRQSQSGKSLNHNGTGLGLSTTKQLVELHGGKIWVKSEPGEGSAFSFTMTESSEKPISDDLPFQLTNTISRDTTQTIVSKPNTYSQKTTFTVLAVDDEPINLEVIENHLKGTLFKIVTAKDGEEAIEKVAKLQPDLILLDLMMPGLDGLQVCRKLRKDYSKSELPIIFLTARNQLSDLVKGFEAGANDYLPKPFFQKELISRIDLHLELSVHKKRLDSLTSLPQNLSKLKSHEDIALHVLNLLQKDPIIENAFCFMGETIIKSTVTEGEDKDIKINPQAIETQESIHNTGTKTEMCLKISSDYSVSAQFPRGSSENWMRHLIQHAQESMNQIKRLSADPHLGLIQTHIHPYLNELLYIKVELNYCLVYRQEPLGVLEETLRIPFKQVLFYLEEKQLHQAHRSYAVNPNQIEFIDSKKQIIYLKGNLEVPAAKKYMAELKKKYPELFSQRNLVTSATE